MDAGPAAVTSPDARIELRRVSKSYPGVRALEGVDLELRSGEVHALAGTNGAGKSTLVRLLGGVERPDSGQIVVGGHALELASPIDALRAGIAVLHQETHLVPEFTVVENFFLGRELRRGLRLDWGAMRVHARARIAELGLALDVERRALSLSAAEAQLVGLARALDLQARFLVLDEPTSSLDRGEVERLFGILRTLRERGLGLVFIAHALEQIFAIADRITVLRDGRCVGSHRARELTPRALVASMLGREEPDPRAARHAAARGTQRPFLVARGLARQGAVAPFDLELRAGEVVGLAGLLGSGRSELARLLFGADPADSGECAIDGRVVRQRSPRTSLAQGLGFCPEDRKQDGIFATLTVRENIALLAQRRMSRVGLLDPRAHERLAQRFVSELRIAAAHTGQALGTLSGGNQQKVLLARALACEPRLLVLDEPTRGIDVGAKVEVERLVEELAQRGTAVLFISSAIEEVLRRASRVLVLREGRVVAELQGAELELERVMTLMAGESV
ncbi:MAG: sugar ABC transporter ATP-binding protein [Planctomycetes bacterium]|nr:sugar ABC transporter ATP-binding protein [Planctomycetota bacterium]